MENNSVNIKELLVKLQAAKSAEELIEMAKAEGAEIAPDKAEELFAKLNAEGELSEESVEAIAGGVFNPNLVRRCIKKNTDSNGRVGYIPIC